MLQTWKKKTNWIGWRLTTGRKNSLNLNRICRSFESWMCFDIFHGMYACVRVITLILRASNDGSTLVVSLWKWVHTGWANFNAYPFWYMHYNGWNIYVYVYNALFARIFSESIILNLLRICFECLKFNQAWTVLLSFFLRLTKIRQFFSTPFIIFSLTQTHKNACSVCSLEKTILNLSQKLPVELYIWQTIFKSSWIVEILVC